MNRPEPRRLVVGVLSLILSLAVVTGIGTGSLGWLFPLGLVGGGVGLVLGRPKPPS